MAELIKTTDSLNDGRKKLNDAITDSNTALSTANTAKQTANLAKAESESTQTQLDTIVIEGDSSVEAAQARVNNSGTAFPTLKQRLDAEHQEVTAQLQQIVHLAPPPNGVDDTQNLIEFFNQGHTNVKFQKGVYRISVPNNSREALKWFVDEENISIVGSDTIILDIDEYTTPSMNNVFSFRRCKNITIEGITYVGKGVLNPENELHVLGKTFAYFEDNCENIRVDINIENARYGVRSGDYLEPSYGYCKNFDITINAKMVGYPVALYLADNVDITVNADGFHRAVYLAGVFHGSVNAKIRNSYGATINVLLTNSITNYSEIQSEQRARGCKNIKVLVTDTGSTEYSPFTSLTGIGLQWVAIGTEFSEIDINFHVRSSNLVASQVGGFHLDSAVTGVPFKFEPYIKFNTLKISGLIDRTSQTTPTNQAGEIYIRGYDLNDTELEHCPEFSNLTVDVTILKGSIQSRAIFVDVPNLKDFIIFKQLSAEGLDLLLSAKTGKIVLDNVKVKNIAFTHPSNEISLKNTIFSNLEFSRVATVSKNNIDAAIFSSVDKIRQVKIITTGAMTYTVPGVFKSTALVKAINGIVLGYPAAGTWKMGTSTELDKYGTAPLTANGYNRFSPFHYKQATYPFYTPESLVVTFDSTTPIPSGLTIVLYIHEEEFITK